MEESNRRMMSEGWRTGAGNDSKRQQTRTKQTSEREKKIDERFGPNIRGTCLSEMQHSKPQHGGERRWGLCRQCCDS